MTESEAPFPFGFVLFFVAATALAGVAGGRARHPKCLRFDSRPVRGGFRLRRGLVTAARQR
jgi:hypothetical protein